MTLYCESKMQVLVVIGLKYSLVCHLLSIPAEGAVECRRLFAAQSFSEAAVELTEAPQT